MLLKKKYSLCGFRKIDTNLMYTHNSYNMLKKKKKFNTNIAFILITLTEINNETHYVSLKKNKKKTKKQKQTKNKPNCCDRIRTLSVNIQLSQNIDYAITDMVQ